LDTLPAQPSTLKGAQSTNGNQNKINCYTSSFLYRLSHEGRYAAPCYSAAVNKIMNIELSKIAQVYDYQYNLQGLQCCQSLSDRWIVLLRLPVEEQAGNMLT